MLILVRHIHEQSKTRNKYRENINITHEGHMILMNFLPCMWYASRNSSDQSCLPTVHTPPAPTWTYTCSWGHEWMRFVERTMLTISGHLITPGYCFKLGLRPFLLHRLSVHSVYGRSGACFPVVPYTKALNVLVISSLSARYYGGTERGVCRMKL